MKDITNAQPRLACRSRAAQVILRDSSSIEENMAAARYIWIDDSLRPASEGVVPFLSAGMQFGFSV